MAVADTPTATVSLRCNAAARTEKFLVHGRGFGRTCGRMASTEPEQDIVEIIDQRRAPTSWVKYVALGVVGVAAVYFGYRLMLHFTPREIAGAATAPLEKGSELTGRFFTYLGDLMAGSRTSTQTVVEPGQVVSTEKTGPLVVAKQDLDLKFTNIDEKLFGTSTAEVRALGQAVYYVPLLGPQAGWRIETLERDGVRVCVVHAPDLRVLTPVGIDTRKIEIRTKTGALRTNSAEMTEAALADLTPRLNRAALAQAANVRPAARKTIATFVRTWLINSGSWGSAKINAIQVLFPGEQGVDTDFAIPGFYDRS